MKSSTAASPNVVRHLMRKVLTLIFIFIFTLSYGQNLPHPEINLKGQSLNDFVPHGWTIIDSAKGDLNKDGIADNVIILQHKDKITLIKFKDTIITQPRILLILFKRLSDNYLHLEERSDSFILSPESSIMDDPYQGIRIENGILKMDFHLFYNIGNWFTTKSTYKFRFDKKRFVLIGTELLKINRETLDYEKYSFNFIINKQIYTKGNEDNGTKKTMLKQILISKPKTFKTFYKPYSWEIEKGIYL